MGRLAEISPRKHEHVTWRTISIAITVHFADGKHAMLQAIRLPVSPKKHFSEIQQPP